MNRATLNYWLDVAIGIAGAISAVTGLVMLLPTNSESGILGTGLRLWSNLHTWSSLAALAGVVGHLALHWRWATAMTRQLAATSRPATSVVSTWPGASAAASSSMSRRAFLALGGAAAVTLGLAVAGYKAIAQVAGNGAGESGSAAATVSQTGAVACPRGLTNDRYPGQCRHYRDADGDGICDYSVPGSGAQTARSFGAGFLGRQGGGGRP